MTNTTRPTADPTIEESAAVAAIAELETRVDQVLDEMRPYIHSHGGEVNVLEVTDEKVARLQMLGSCNGCPMSMLTMRLGIERLLAEKVPELNGAEAVFVDDFEWPEITSDE